MWKTLFEVECQEKQLWKPKLDVACDHFGMVPPKKGGQRSAQKCHKRGAKGLMVLTPQNMCTKDDPTVRFSTFPLFFHSVNKYSNCKCLFGLPYLTMVGWLGIDVWGQLKKFSRSL
jgi:hypothetical protein